MRGYSASNCQCIAPDETIVLQSMYEWQLVVFDAMKSRWSFSKKEIKEGRVFGAMGIAPVLLATKEVMWFSFTYHDDGTQQLSGIWVCQSEPEIHLLNCIVVHWLKSRRFRGGWSKLSTVHEMSREQPYLVYSCYINTVLWIKWDAAEYEHVSWFGCEAFAHSLSRCTNFVLHWIDENGWLICWAQVCPTAPVPRIWQRISLEFCRICAIFRFLCLAVCIIAQYRHCALFKRSVIVDITSGDNNTPTLIDRNASNIDQRIVSYEHNTIVERVL